MGSRNPNRRRYRTHPDGAGIREWTCSFLSATTISVKPDAPFLPLICRYAREWVPCACVCVCVYCSAVQSSQITQAERD